MKNVFLDTNVLMDFLTSRKPFDEDCEQLFFLAEQEKLRLYVCALSFTNVHYLVKRVSGLSKANQTVAALSSIVTIVPVDEPVILNAVHSEIPDFEDAVQYYSALQAKKIDMIVTRDKKGFSKSALPVFNPVDAINVLGNA